MSNSFKRHGWCCEFIPSLPDIAQCDNCRRKNGINKWSPRKWGKFILTCVVLLWLLSMLRGILAGKYNEGNISRGNIYVAFFCYCYCYWFSAALLCYDESRHQPFQTVNNNEGLFFPLKRRKPSKVKNKKTILTRICALQHLITCSLFFLLSFVFF